MPDKTLNNQTSSSFLKKIINARLIHNHKIIENDVLFIQNGLIIDPQNHFFTKESSPDLVIDAKGLFVVPGFIDIQINGAFGVDFSQTSADFDEQKVKADLTKVSKGLLRTGCTSFIPTLISSEDHVYKNMLPLIGPRKGNLKNGAEILGSHVEGPFITPEKCGVHEKYKFKTLKNTYGSENIRNSIKLITVAPEVEGVLDNIERLVKSGITVINFYGKLVVERSTNNDNLPSVFVYSTQFMTKYLNSGYQGVSKWTKKVDIFSKDLLFVPIHNGAHWSLCLVDFQAFRIDYIDSMYGENANLDFNSWAENPRLKKVPQQKNSYDCGVFTLASLNTLVGKHLYYNIIVAA
ncbi:20040_t:CDS:2 [Entrophospora sp. SA101]|nr:20040_t:CDS:2 [Entrophospora sp. SA101]